MSVGCAAGVYIVSRKLLGDPAVQLGRELRQTAVKSECAGYDRKAAAYKDSAIFQKLSKVPLNQPTFYGAGELAARE